MQIPSMLPINHRFIRHLTRNFGCFVSPWAYLCRVHISQQSTGEALVEPLSSRLNGQYHAEKADVFASSADRRALNVDTISPCFV